MSRKSPRGTFARSPNTFRNDHLLLPRIPSIPPRRPLARQEPRNSSAPHVTVLPTVVPRLASQAPGYLAKQLENFAEGRRAHPGDQMRSISAFWTDASSSLRCAYGT